MPPVANWLISLYGWRTSYVILGALIVVVVTLAAQFLSNPKQNEQVLNVENRKGENELNSSNEGFSLKEAIYTRQFWMGFAVFFSLGFSLLTMTVHIVPHVTDLGISATTAANIFRSSMRETTPGVPCCVSRTPRDSLAGFSRLLVCHRLQSVGAVAPGDPVEDQHERECGDCQEQGEQDLAAPF